jgi:hypothetical protein
MSSLQIDVALDVGCRHPRAPDEAWVSEEAEGSVPRVVAEDLSVIKDRSHYRQNRFPSNIAFYLECLRDQSTLSIEK